MAGAGALLFALVMFIIAGVSFLICFVALQVWLAASMLLHLSEGHYVRAVLMGCVLAYLVHIDIAIWFR